MKFGLDQSTIDAIQGILANYPQVETAILYGSRATGSYRRGSDIDLTLTGDGLDLSLQFEIEIDLDDLLLPYMIDLSILADIGNDDLIDQIGRYGQVFYDRSQYAYKCESGSVYPS